MFKRLAFFAGGVAAVFLAGGFLHPFNVNAASITLTVSSDACSLLTTEEVSAALEVTSLAGKPAIAGSPKSCIWSDSPTDSIDHRRVTLSITNSVVGFNAMKSSTRIVTEAVSGIGDEAFYELPKGESPFLVVRKGQATFTLRVLNGLKLKAFSLEQEKTKEATLGKAAAGRFQP